MAQLTAPIHDVQHQAERAVREASPWIEILARLGYAAKGVVYCLVGLLAIASAFGSRGAPTGSKGAMAELLDKPFGRVLLGIVAVGLAGYALWCFIRALFDPEHEGKGGKGIGKRVFQFFKGVVHASLVLAAVALIRGSGSGGGDDSSGLEKWTAKLMSAPLGIWLVLIAGVSVIGYGLYQIYRGWTVKLDDQLSLGSMSPAAHTWTIRLSRFGIAARGVIFCVIGFFLALAAIRSDPTEAQGVGESLATLERQPYGPWLLAVVALGLIAYGIYEFIRAKYRRINAAA